MWSRLAQSFARLVGIASALLGLWVLFVNLSSISYSGLILGWILIAGLAGAVGGTVFLLSFEGPDRFHTRKVRLAGWAGMLALALLPSSISMLHLGLVLMTMPTLRVEPSYGETAEAG